MEKEKVYGFDKGKNLVEIKMGADELNINRTSISIPNKIKPENDNGNIAIGNVMKNMGEGDMNIAIGSFGILNNCTTGSHNIGIGTYSMGGVVTARCNIAIGNYCLHEGDGGYNIAIGDGALAYGMNKDNIAIGYYSGSPNGESYEKIICIGHGTTATGNRQMQLGDDLMSVYTAKAINIRSDRRDKTDIKDTPLGLSFIKLLRPVQYKRNPRERYLEEGEERRYCEKPENEEKAGTRYHNGLIAQEVAEAAEKLGIDFAGWQDHKVNGGKDVQTLAYEEFIAPIIKSIQELAEENEQLKIRIKKLEK